MQSSNDVPKDLKTSDEKNNIDFWINFSNNPDLISFKSQEDGVKFFIEAQRSLISIAKEAHKNHNNKLVKKSMKLQHNITVTFSAKKVIDFESALASLKAIHETSSNLELETAFIKRMKLFHDAYLAGANAAVVNAKGNNNYHTSKENSRSLASNSSTISARS